MRSNVSVHALSSHVKTHFSLSDTVQNRMPRAKISPSDQNHTFFLSRLDFLEKKQTKNSSFSEIRRSCGGRRTIIKSGINHTSDLKHSGTSRSRPKVSGTKITFIFLYFPSDPSWEDQVGKPSVQQPWPSLDYSLKLLQVCYPMGG